MRFPKTLALVMLAMGLALALPAGAQQKPFTQEQVNNMVRDGFGDESGAKLIEQRGIDFAPAEDFVQSLKAAGASEAFLKALRAAKPPEPTSAKKPLNQVQVFALLAGQVPSHRVATLVRERGIDFEPQQDYLDEVRLGGGGDELITALRGAKVTGPATVDPAAQARQVEVRQHVARGAELEQKGRFAEAEQEYRAALLVDSQNPDLYVSLAHVLERQEEWGDAAAAARQALRLNPNDEEAHFYLGVILELEDKADLNGAIREFREALRLDPNDESAHINLGNALGRKGDAEGAIAQYREAVRLNPNDEVAHVALGTGLERKGDRDEEIREYREALRLNPNLAEAHFNLGVALERKGDADAAVAEYREAVRLKWYFAEAHAKLAYALERKGDLRGALEEYGMASVLDPKDATHMQNFERLRQQLNK